MEIKEFLETFVPNYEENRKTFFETFTENGKEVPLEKREYVFMAAVFSTAIENFRNACCKKQLEMIGEAFNVPNLTCLYIGVRDFDKHPTMEDLKSWKNDEK